MQSSIRTSASYAGLEQLKALPQVQSLTLGSTRHGCRAASSPRMAQTRIADTRGERGDGRWPGTAQGAAPSPIAHLRSTAFLTQGWCTSRIEANSRRCVGNLMVADAGLAHLRELKQLQTLYLWNIKIADAGLVHLEELPQLQTLYLYSVKVTDATSAR